MSTFLIIVSPDEESGGYTVSVPGMPGCITHGESVEDALANAKEAIALYLHDETPESLAAAGVQRNYVLAQVEVPIPVAS